MNRKFLNLGCGSRFNKGAAWVNIDIHPSAPTIIAHNIIEGIPFQENTFDLVYHSHVLEHIPKQKSNHFISECVRVLKPGGVLRVVVPDLEQIAKKYLEYLDKGIECPNSGEIRANYDWIMLEMYDQVIRNKTGGEMLNFLANDNLVNKDFILQRCGQEFASYINGRNDEMKAIPIKVELSLKTQIRKFLSFFKNLDTKEQLIKLLLKDEYETLQTSRFRAKGEIHQWMYDRYSLYNILKHNKLRDIIQRDAFTSYLDNWPLQLLDTQDSGAINKPDSLFIEAIK